MICYSYWRVGFLALRVVTLSEPWQSDASISWIAVDRSTESERVLKLWYNAWLVFHKDQLLLKIEISHSRYVVIHSISEDDIENLRHVPVNVSYPLCFSPSRRNYRSSRINQQWQASCNWFTQLRWMIQSPAVRRELEATFRSYCFRLLQS